MKLRRIAAAILGITVIGISGLCYAQNGDFGKREYDNSCAVCHGYQGEGKGPYSAFINASIPNLTTLSKGNNGVFPFQQVYEVIDGRRVIKAHGSQDMPIWGTRYMVIADAHQFTPYDREAYVRTRILALTEYIYRLQAK